MPLGQRLLKAGSLGIRSVIARRCASRPGRAPDEGVKRGRPDRGRRPRARGNVNPVAASRAAHDVRHRAGAVRRMVLLRCGDLGGPTGARRVARWPVCRQTRRGDASTYRTPVRGSVYSPVCQPAFSRVAAQARSASGPGSWTATASGCGVARTR